MADTPWWLDLSPAQTVMPTDICSACGHARILHEHKCHAPCGCHCTVNPYGTALWRRARYCQSWAQGDR